MSKASLALAIAGTTLPLFAQICDPMPQATQWTHNPSVTSFYYGNIVDNTLNLYFDLEVKGTAIVVDGFRVLSYDQGAGNPVVPNQVGNFATVNIYSFPVTSVGNTGAMTGWTHIGVGTMTIAATPAYSTVANIRDLSNAPLVMTNGVQGIALELVPTNAVGTPTQTGPNAANRGALHTLGASPNPVIDWQDQFIKINNDAIQQNAWQTTGVGTGPFPLIPNATPNGTQDSINISLTYTPASGDGGSVSYGSGCYERYRTAYESFPESATGPDLLSPSNPIGATGGMDWVFTGQNYIVTPSTVPYTAPAGSAVNITTLAYQSSSSANWDDAISAPYSFPATWSNGGLQHPAGVATQFCVSSNGFLYLGDITNNSFAVCGAPYGAPSTGHLDFQPSIRLYHTDLDPTVGGGIYVEVDPAPTPAWVRVTWDSVQEWGVAAAVNTMQVTMYDGGLVQIKYVALGNQSATNNAIVGYFEGNMAPTSGALDWTALVATALPQTGNGDFPPVLKMSSRPVLGTTVNFVTDGITPGTLGGVFIVSLFETTPVDLSVYGAPGCFGHVDIINGFVGANFLGLNAMNQISVPLTIPNNAAFNSTNFHAQTLTLLPGINALGAQSTNGLCVNVGG